MQAVLVSPRRSAPNAPLSPREVRIRVLLQARQMGCGASKPHTTVHLPPESSLRRTITPDPQSLAHGPQPTIRTAAEVLTIRLLDGLAAREEHVSLPVQPHAQRLGSAQRGWSRAAFRGLRAFYSKHGMLDKLMADLCKQEAAEHEASSRLSWSSSSQSAAAAWTEEAAERARRRRQRARRGPRGPRRPRKSQRSPGRKRPTTRTKMRTSRLPRMTATPTSVRDPPAAPTQVFFCLIKQSPHRKEKKRREKVCYPT